MVAETICEQPRCQPELIPVHMETLMKPTSEGSAAGFQWSLCLFAPSLWSLENQPPWLHIFTFKRKCEELRQLGRLQNRHQLIPSGARLCAVAASLPQLWQSRRLLTSVEGLDLSAANELFAAHSRQVSVHCHFAHLI